MRLDESNYFSDCVTLDWDIIFLSHSTLSSDAFKPNCISKELILKIKMKLMNRGNCY